LDESFGLQGAQQGLSLNPLGSRLSPPLPSLFGLSLPLPSAP
jgi:hypothetical protein